MIQITNDYRLIVLALLVSSVSVFINIEMVKHLFKTNNHIKNRMFLVCGLLVGTSLAGMHFLDVLAFPPITYIHLTHALDYFSITWLFALVIGSIVVYIPAQKTLPSSTLAIVSSVCGVSGLAMYYFSVIGMKISPPVSFNIFMSLFALLITVTFCALYLITLFWLKNYLGQKIWLTKAVFSVIAALCLTGIHITYNATVEVSPTATSVNNMVLSNDTLLGITVALSCLCIFCIIFIIAIFYDKLDNGAFRFDRIKDEESSELSKLALIDALTKLPNRRALQQNLEAGARRCQRSSSTMAIAFIDLDDFKPINDNYGHQIGDELLVQVANRLNTAVRNCDVVTRTGGDEFIALIENIKSNEDIVPILERIVQCISQPFSINSHELFISASVGVAVYPKDSNLGQLIACADAAMYRAKAEGKNKFRFFDAAIEVASDQMLEMQKSIKNALANDELKLHFQLKIDSVTQAPIGAEALLRWVHPSKGLMLPYSFLEEAERFGLMVQIGTWVIEETCRTLHQLLQHGIALTISVNLSTQQLRNPNLADDIKTILGRFELPNSSIMFEISEAIAIKNPDLVNKVFTNFRNAQINVAIDNFGANPFNLAYLKNLEISELKLDKEFTLDVGSNKESYAIVEAVIKLAHALELSVTAEGVETESQRKTLVSLGCNQMQGYLFSRPLAENKLVEMIGKINSGFLADDHLFVKDHAKTINQLP